MATPIEIALRDQLTDRRGRLESAIQRRPSPHLSSLLEEVDAALERMDEGSYGLCDACHESIEPERLIVDPLVRLCLPHLTAPQQRALEDDLELASRIQSGLLPSRDFTLDGWQVSYHYEAARLVSGDYVDLVPSGGGSFYFMLGDVSGKGVSASLLMSHLHAVFRSLIPIGLPLKDLVERASRIFCESTLPTHFATLVCGRASSSGEVEICNAGHLPPLLCRNGQSSPLYGTDLPVGIFCNEEFTSQSLSLNSGDSLLLYTDGLTEARNPEGDEYGIERLESHMKRGHTLTPGEVIRSFVGDISGFRRGSPSTDDLTLMLLRKLG